MNQINLIGKKVKCYVTAIQNYNASKLYAGEELTILGIEVTKKQLVLESRSGEIWKLYPTDVRFLNNQKVYIY